MMRLFLSYRRDDTAGRAGRLFDGLTTRLGTGTVFQDVSSISPGVDFETAVVSSLATTDAAIIVIGSDWATLRGSDGLRRLDHPDDYVRREIAAALESGRPVVPVLVGEARMPEPEDLPDELRPLVKRQAITVRDVAWNDDVDSLVRRLRGEVAPVRHRRRLATLAATAALVAVIVIAVVALRSNGDGDGGGASTESTPPCVVVDENAWSIRELAADPSGRYTPSDGSSRLVGYRVTTVRAKQQQSGWRVLVDVEVSNLSTPVESAATSSQQWYIGASDFHRLVVDGVGGGDAVCFNLLAGAQALPVGQRASIRVGFDTPADPRQSELALETAGTPIPLAGRGS